MQIGMIGLGRMGASMVTRLLRGVHACMVHDQAPEGVARLVALGATGAASLQQFVDMMKAARAIWLMVPAAAVDAVLEQLTPLLQAGDIVIDGGNSHYHDDLRRAEALGQEEVATQGALLRGGLQRGPVAGRDRCRRRTGRAPEKASTTRRGNNAAAFLGGFRLWDESKLAKSLATCKDLA